jgi:hypothetical protein
LAPLDALRLIRPRPCHIPDRTHKRTWSARPAPCPTPSRGAAPEGPFSQIGYESPLTATIAFVVQAERYSGHVCRCSASRIKLGASLDRNILGLVKQLVILGVALTMVLAGSACGSSSAARDGRVAGSLRGCGSGPLDVHKSKPSQCSGLAASVFVLDGAHQIVATEQTASGRFSFDLVSRHYEVVFEGPGRVSGERDLRRHIEEVRASVFVRPGQITVVFPLGGHRWLV